MKLRHRKDIVGIKNGHMQLYPLFVKNISQFPIGNIVFIFAMHQCLRKFEMIHVREYDRFLPNMKQKNFAVGKESRRCNRQSRRLRLSLLEDADDDIVLSLSYRYWKIRSDLKRIHLSSKTISSIRFNINAMSDEECLTMFRFRPSEIDKLRALIEWDVGRTESWQHQ